MTYRFRMLLPALTGIIFLAGTTQASFADDYLNRAAEQYREKDFGGAYASAEKSTDLTHRSFVRGMAALRMDKFEEASAFLAEAEQRLPMVADYAALYQAEALLKLKRYPAAAAKAASVLN